jgi:hypothetical protein
MGIFNPVILDQSMDEAGHPEIYSSTGTYRAKRTLAICDRVLASRFYKPVAEFSKGALRNYRSYLVIFRRCFALSFS